MHIPNQRIHVALRYFATIAREVFQFSLFGFFLLLFADQLLPLLASRFLSLNDVFVLVLVSGIIAVSLSGGTTGWTQKKVNTGVKRSDLYLIVSIATVGALTVFIRLKPLGAVSWILAVLSWLLIVLISVFAIGMREDPS